MDISAIEGQELSAVEFVSDYVRLRFDGPLLTLYAWPHVLLEDFSLAFGQPDGAGYTDTAGLAGSRRSTG